MNNPLKRYQKIIGLFSIIAACFGVYVYGWTFHPGFRQTDIFSIEAIKFSHSIPGGVLESRILEPSRIESFVADLRWARKRGIAKMFTCHLVQINLNDGRVLNFRTNGRAFYSPDTDTLYEFWGSENKLEKYWKLSAVCE